MPWQYTGPLAAALVLLLGAMAACAAPGAPASADFHVSTSGDDAGPGTRDKPFATLARARDAVRKKIAAGLAADVRVVVRGGTYRLAEPVVFGPADSGTEQQAIVYTAWPGERPVFSGGRVIKGWRPGPDGARRVTIDDVKAGRWQFNELFVGGQRRPRARHPNEGYCRVEKVVDDRHSFQFTAGDLPEIKDLAGCELVLLHDWSISRTPIGSLDAKTRTLTTAQFIGGPAAFWRINGFEAKPRYFIENAPELLDAPGEWYLNRKTGELTYRPLADEKLGETDVVAPAAGQLLIVRGEAGKPVSNLRFEGLTFEHCAWQPDGVRYAGGQAGFHWAAPPQKGWGWQPVTAAVHLEFARRCRFERCEVRLVGGSGVWFARGCRDSGLMSCRVRDVAGNGVMLGEAKAAKGEELAGNNSVVNSVIERCGATYYGAVGIWVGLSDRNAIANNEIAHHPYTGVSVGWMWNPTPTPCMANVVENNHIHHVMQVLSDGGGIYTLGLQPGAALRGNWIHDVPLNAGRAESNGMFLDEGTTDIVIEGNLIHGVDRSPLRFHKAGKNLVKANVLVCGKGVPLVRYNATDSKNITLQDNAQVKDDDLTSPEFRDALKRMKESAGPRPTP
ncbi:MAG TPA: right-handed parallel beta-helix repeat-containing protein [Phycisphaerae bacterium]|nr:right-handed parallel beta-helix repeat-containing protein [Phycisphaerae bacterium]